MNTLYVLNETYSNGYSTWVLDFLSFISIICGIFVIITKNPVISILFLIGLFLSIASYLIILGISFIGLSYLLVYVGAVSILFLFILMLINVRISELLSETSNSIPLAFIIAICFNYSLYQILPFNILDFNNYTLNFYNLFSSNSYNNYIINKNFDITNYDNVFFATAKSWDTNIAETTHITSIGNVIYSSHSIWLILTSIILLLAMVGAIVITIKQKN